MAGLDPATQAARQRVNENRTTKHTKGTKMLDATSDSS